MPLSRPMKAGSVGAGEGGLQSLHVGFTVTGCVSWGKFFKLDASVSPIYNVRMI